MDALRLESEAFPVLKILVGPLEYTLCYPISAVAKAEAATQTSLKSLQDWLKIESKHYPDILKAGLAKYHADLSPEALDALVSGIVESLTAEGADQLHYALCKLAFPKAMAAIEERQAKGQAVSKNEQSPDAA